MEKTKRVAIELTDQEGWALAQFAKRSTFDTFRQCAEDNEEAQRMIDAIEAVRKGLAEAGWAPR